MSDKILDQHLNRKAILYIRQSTMTQVIHNKESRKLQYAMKRRLQELGWSKNNIITIEDDLGCSAAGTVERSGFERMVTEVCLGKVGAVAARELSRFARNNTQWHHLIEMCAVVDTLLIDVETVFDPHLSNDRLLLGLKGNLHVYELDVLRQRGLEARKQKASRGELVNNVPAGFIKNEDGEIQKDPNKRVQRAITRVFEKMFELGSARQVLFWHKEHDILLPVTRANGRGWEVTWKMATDSIVQRILWNPIYAGAYAWGKRGVVSEVKEGRITKSVRARSIEEFEVLITEHHEGYISFDEYQRIREMIDKNNFAKAGVSSGAPRAGSALLVGLLRCRQCGRKMSVEYGGKVSGYRCPGISLKDHKISCLRIGGKGIDEALSAEILRVVEPGAIEAAQSAHKELLQKHAEILEALDLELAGVRHEVDLARRQYDAVDPSNRLVADELESRWNTALEKAERIEERIANEKLLAEEASVRDERELFSLAEDLEKIWNNPSTDNRLKKRIARTLIEEVLVGADNGSELIDVMIHWKGGVHTELQVRRRKQGEHGTATSKDIVDAVRVLARVTDDRNIAQLLNRNRLKTGKGNPWSRERVKDLRQWHKIRVYDSATQETEGWMTLKQASALVGVSPRTLRLAAESGEVKSLHPLPFGNWIFQRKDLETPEVKRRFENCRPGRRRPTIPNPKQLNLMITER
jgi:DNA invertase Pin-like site-specific DNA recombinase